MWALSLPTIWFVMTLVSQYTGNDIVGQIVFWTGSLVMLLGLPYVAYTILVITQEEAIALKSRLQIGLFVISLTVGGLGYVIGKNHHLLISCDDFRLSGNYVPENCADIDEL